MKKKKTGLWITLIGLDVVLTVFFLVISIIMLASLSRYEEIRTGTGLFSYLANHPLTYFLGFVLPLFVLLVANIIGLVFYVRRMTKKEPPNLDNLTDEQKDELRKQLIDDLKNKE